MMRFDRIGGRRYARFPGMADSPGLVHAFSTRPDDVSPRVDAHTAERTARRRQMAADLGLDPDRLCYCQQVHQNRIEVIDAPRAGGAIAETDAIITNQPGVPLMVFSADCPLVLVYDGRTPALGVAHASWRCTVADVTGNLVRAMASQFGSRTEEMSAGIGPSAGPEAYEVKQDVVAAVRGVVGATDAILTRGGRTYFDLWRANRDQLVAAGVAPERIEIAEICTMTDTQYFYSFRREGAGCGHFGLMAATLPV
jgi:YfiH family protein